MLRLFPEFTTYPTHHCVTGSLKHIYDYHGYPVSEDLLLGLGRGLGFVYFHIKGTDPFYGGRANVARPGEEGLEKTAGRRTGVTAMSHATASARTAQDALRALLEAGEPVMVYLDMGFLPYFDLPEDYHFGGHVVVVAGYDPDTGRVLVADRDKQLHPVEWDALERARGSQYKPFPPRHTWYTFDFAAARPPAPARSGKLSARCATGCWPRRSPTSASKGSVKRSGRRPSGRRSSTPMRCAGPASTWRCSSTGVAAPAGASSATCTRRFLAEAALLTSEPRLTGMATELTAIGDWWEQVADAFATAAQASHPADLLETATKPMGDIADLEQDFWERLAGIIAA